MQKVTTLAVSLSALMALTACASAPMGPSVEVMPAANKPFEVFQQDQTICKQYAGNQVGGQAGAANETAVGTALLGTVLGAGLGAAVGGGQGAGAGAAIGAVFGTAIGAGNSQQGQMTIQQQYDNAYSQCMYAKGNQVIQPPVQTLIQPTIVYPVPPVVYVPPTGEYYAPPPPMGYPL